MIPRRHQLGATIALTASILVSPVARSEQPAPAPPALSPPPETLSLYYRELLRPSRRRAEVHLELALEQLDAIGIGASLRSSGAVETALQRLRYAHVHAPDDPEILYQLGLALSNGIAPRSRAVNPRIDEAIAALERLRALDPGYEAFSVGSELAVLHTRRREFRAAIEEYERAIPAALTEDGLGTVLANYAEVSMEAGDLVGAVERYERALEFESRVGQSSQGLALIAFGLAVALDRLGESEPAIERAHQAVMASGGTLDVLTSNDVFFEPQEELRYYQMLGELAIARFASSPVERLSHLNRALTNVRRFLDEGGAAGPFAEVAAARKRTIEAEIEQRRAAVPAPERTPAQRSARTRR